jgi:PAS domain S-box-containing protein
VKATDALYRVDRSLLPAAGGAWLTAGAVAIAYFLAAQLGLALLSKSTDVAVFWPASGFAVGILIVLGPRVRVAVAIGVVSATIAANLTSDRSLWTSVFKGLCNAGEAVFTAWLIEQWFGHAFAFADLRRVLGFVAAACLGAAISALGGAATMTLLHTAAPFWDVWRAWFLSDGVGIVVVAPLIISLSQVWREPPSRSEWIEGIGGVALLALISWYVVGHPTGSWLSFDPDVLALPPLLWLTARCQLTFGIAGAFVTSLAFICATTFGIGHFGDEDVPLMGRVNGAQVVVTMVTLYTLVLAALFAERRRNEAALKDSNIRLQSALHAEEQSKARLADAMAAGQVTAFEWSAITGLSKRENAARILGLKQGSMVSSPCKDFLRRVHADDRELFKKRIRELRPNNNAYALTFRFIRPDGHLVWLEETAKGEFDAAGRLSRVKGLTRDITERKRAEFALAERNLQLALAGKVGRVGSYAYDVSAEKLQVSEGYAALHGLPEGTTETTLREWRARVHPEDLGRVEGAHNQVVGDKQREYSAEYRIVRSDGQVRWIERRCFISYDNDAHPHRVVGVSIDITARKQAEKQRDTLNAELDHRVKNVLATVGAIIFQTQNANATIEDFVASVDRRIKSLATTHELLSHTRWHGVSLHEIIQCEFAPYSAGKSDIGGPSITLRPQVAQAMAMVLHELATNAAKYGALSNDTGRVSVRWFWLPNAIPDQRLAIEWQETGGPPVSPPNASGYGTSIICELLPYELGGTVDLSFAPGGVQCRLEIPADAVGSDDGVEHYTQASHH